MSCACLHHEQCGPGGAARENGQAGQRVRGACAPPPVSVPDLPPPCQCACSAPLLPLSACLLCPLPVPPPAPVAVPALPPSCRVRGNPVAAGVVCTSTQHPFTNPCTDPKRVWRPGLPHGPREALPCGAWAGAPVPSRRPHCTLLIAYSTLHPAPLEHRVGVPCTRPYAGGASLTSTISR